MSQKPDISVDRFRSRSAFFGYEFQTFVLFLGYIGFWLAFFYFVPDSVYHHQVARMTIEKASVAIPMINLFAANSPSPALVSFFMTIQWLMVPFHIALGLFKASRHRPTLNLKPIDRYALFPATILFAVLPILLIRDSTVLTGTRMSNLLAHLESSLLLSFVNSIMWPAFTALFCYLPLAVLYTYRSQ